MTDGLDLGDTYDATLDRIKAQDSYKSRIGTTALMWICYSERQLGPEELCQALAVKIGSTDYNADDAPSIQTVLSCCQGFVMVDKERSTIRLIHYTLREYLINCRSFFQSPHSTIAETCLTYLNSEQVMALSYTGVQNTQPSGLLQYSSLYWGAHMREELTNRGRILALKLFSRYECHVSIRLLLEYTLGRHHLRSIAQFYKFTGLHCVSLFGLVDVARALTMIDGVNINGTDETGATPLIWAAMSGHEAAVKLLLELEDVDPDRPDSSGRTPMSWAAENGHEAVVKLLLAREDANFDRLNNHDEALWLAVRGGHEAVVGVLLWREDVNPNSPDHKGQTPLSWAAQNGSEAIVKLLLGRGDVDPDRPDRWGQTPISWASENGYEAVVELLLEREGVNPDRLDEWNRTPILLAAQNGYEAVVKLLLEREDVNPDRPDRWGRAPISWAARNGHEAVVRLLLGREDVHPNRSDYNGQTPILLAAENECEAVVKLLLGRGDVGLGRRRGVEHQSRGLSGME